MRQLSGTDSLFLRLERGNQYMHVAGLGIYDPSTAPGGKVRFKDVLRFFEARLDALPLFRRRLVTVPLGLDRPYWIEDPEIDVEFHVRHIALPHPGDWRQLCIQVARIHSRPLDRSKPLWEAYVIEGLDHIPGLPSGSFALYLKLHHCAVDGEAGTELIRAIHSTLADDFSEPVPPARRYKDRVPTAPELYLRAVARGVGRVPSLARLSAETAARVAGAGAALPGGLASLLSKQETPAVTRLVGRAAQTTGDAFRQQGLGPSGRRGRRPAARQLQGDPGGDPRGDDQRPVHDDRGRGAAALSRRQGRIAGRHAHLHGADVVSRTRQSPPTSVTRSAWR